MKAELLHEAAYFRAAAEEVWSPQTAHAGDFDPLNPPAGQCGVTSIEFLRRLLLHEDRRAMGYAAFYQCGSLVDTDGNVVGDNHCWGRVVYRGDDLQIGLTEDQYVGPDGNRLPPLMVQRTGEFDGHSVRRVVRQSTPSLLYDSRNYRRRHADLMIGLWANDDYDLPWYIARQRHEPRYRELLAEAALR